MDGVLVRLGEYMVRRTRIRRYYVARLMESIGYQLEKHGVKGTVKRAGPWLFIETGEPVRAAEIVSRVFGVSSTYPVAVAMDIDGVVEAALRLLGDAESFVVRVYGGDGRGRRGLELMLGAVLHDIYGYRVDLSGPEKTIHVFRAGEKFFVADTGYSGVGGLPYGVEGCLVALVSGGVDSAVATWLAMKRGARIIPVYMDMGVYWSTAARERAVRALQLLWEHTPWVSMKAYIVRGVGEIVASAPVPPRLRCLFCKANMYRIAGLLAAREKCYGVVTGEAVGQVASQTLINLSWNTRLAETPIFRPIAFMDKLEITQLAEKLGFGELNRSVGECGLRPESPETSMGSEEAKIIREALEVTHDAAIEAVRRAEKIIYRIRQG